jgi:hypothetical protein
MNKTVSVLARAKVSADKNPEAPAPSRVVVSNVGVAALSSPAVEVQGIPDIPVSFRYPVQNLPVSYRDRFKAIKRVRLYRESFNQFMLDAINEKLAKEEKKMAKLAAKG